MNDELVLEMKSGQLGEFYPLLQQGFAVTVRVGCTIDLLLSREFGLSPDYVTKRITTIFLNGQAVDYIKRTVVKEGAVIALSGAAPGLVGAILRRGGHYAAMRGEITYWETAAAATSRLAKIRVKLFSILLPELGAHFLHRDIVLTSSELADFATFYASVIFGFKIQLTFESDYNSE